MDQFLKLAKELKFDLNQDEIDDLLNKSSAVLENIEMIKNFDLSRYEHLHFSSPVQTRMRDDEIIENKLPFDLVLP